MIFRYCEVLDFVEKSFHGDMDFEFLEGSGTDTADIHQILDGVEFSNFGAIIENFNLKAILMS